MNLSTMFVKNSACVRKLYFATLDKKNTIHYFVRYIFPYFIQLRNQDLDVSMVNGEEMVFLKQFMKRSDAVSLCNS